MKTFPFNFRGIRIALLAFLAALSSTPLICAEPAATEAPVIDQLVLINRILAEVPGIPVD